MNIVLVLHYAIDLHCFFNILYFNLLHCKVNELKFLYVRLLYNIIMYIFYILKEVDKTVYMSSKPDFQSM